MKIIDELIGLTVIFLVGFFNFRIIFRSICEYLLKKGERINRKKGQSFIEWFLWSRYKNEIPKVLLYFYYGFIILHIFAYLLILVVLIFNLYGNIILSTIMDIIITDGIILIILGFAFYSPKRGEVKVDRWIKKKHKT